jgi:hypothetical protein
VAQWMSGANSRKTHTGECCGRYIADFVDNNSDYQVTGVSGGPMSTGSSEDTSATPEIALALLAMSSLAVPVMQPISSNT